VPKRSVKRLLTPFTAIALLLHDQECAAELRRAAVSGDNNALHINEEFAQRTQFKSRIAHGLLSASVISAAIAGRLLGPGTIYMGQNLRFVAPVRPGDTVYATVTVKELMPEKCRARLTTVCTVNGEIVIDGDALVMTTSREARKT
jgi:3-hydroxybutyryl-CoA dehydratase